MLIDQYLAKYIMCNNVIYHVVAIASKGFMANSFYLGIQMIYMI